jgi:hypothetical protein
MRGLGATKRGCLNGKEGLAVCRRQVVIEVEMGGLAEEDAVGSRGVPLKVYRDGREPAPELEIQILDDFGGLGFAEVWWLNGVLQRKIRENRQRNESASHIAQGCSRVEKEPARGSSRAGSDG